MSPTTPNHDEDEERRIALATLELIEEIAAERSGDGGTDTPDERAWSHVYQLAHYASSAKCRRNHPEWGGPVKKRLG